MRGLLTILTAALVLAVALTAMPAAGSSTPATVSDVITLHGWFGSPSGWSGAIADYQAAGFTVHALSLPRSGANAGDTLINADYVEAYIATNGLTAVQIDGHSLGGTLVFELTRNRRNPAIVSAVTRDSNIHNTTGSTGTSCSFVPDQCESSPVRQAIVAAAPGIPVLDLTNSTYSARAEVTCIKTFNMAHNDYPSNSDVTAAAIAWAQGADPCAAAVTPTPAATSTPTAPAPTATTAPATPTPPAPTSTPTAAPATPTPTATPWYCRYVSWC